VYVFNPNSGKIVICDYNYVEMWNICIPNFGQIFPYQLNQLSSIQLIELDVDRVMVVADSYVGIYQTFSGQVIAENGNFIQADVFGKPVVGNDNSYYVQADHQLVKFNENLLIEWTYDYTFNASFSEAAIIPIPNDPNAIYTFVKNDQQSIVTKLNNNDGSILWEKDFTPYLPPNSNWIFNKLRNGVASLDGGFVTKLDYNFTQPFSRGAILIKIDGDGNLVWENDYPEPIWYYEVNYATNDGGYILTDYGNNEINYIKTNSLGQIEPLCDGSSNPVLLPDLIMDVAEFENITGVGDTICVNDDLFLYYFAILNQGNADMTNDFDINIYLSQDDVLDNGDQILLELIGSPIEVDGIFEIEGIETIGNIPDGEYHFLCPDDIQGFTTLGEFGGSKYFISDDVENPIPAQVIAENLGGYLATIDSEEENDFIFSQISELAYIGINDSNTEDQLEWANGDAVSYTNFDICDICNENSDEMDFVVMHSWNGGWSWSNVFNQRKYIVEIPCTAMVSNIPNAPVVLLPNEFHEKSSEIVIEKIYPNPSSDFIFTKIKNAKAEEIELQVFDARGSIVKSKIANLTEGENTISISIADLPNGVYTLKLPNVASQNCTQRFVKVQN